MSKLNAFFFLWTEKTQTSFRSLDSTQVSSLIPILTSLLGDHSPLTIGAVAVAFDTLSSTRLDLLHPHYRRLCRMLCDIDEWGQVQVIDLLTRYARHMFSAPGVGQHETR